MANIGVKKKDRDEILRAFEWHAKKCYDLHIGALLCWENLCFGHLESLKYLERGMTQTCTLERSSATVLSVWLLSHLRTKRGRGLGIKPYTLGKGKGKPRDSAQDAENRISQSWRQKASAPCICVQTSLLGTQHHGAAMALQRGDISWALGTP